MELNKQFTKIYLSLYRELYQEAVGALQEIGVTSINVEAGRSLQLDHAKGLAKLLGQRESLDEEPVTVLSFLVPLEQERPVLECLVGKLGLDAPGRGSIYTKTVTVLAVSDAWQENRLILPASSPRVMSTGLAGLSCVVQKGEANPVARLGLTTGAAIPVITYGTGTGLRNRLGAWRILVPAEKEIATLILHSAEAEALMDLMIDAGELDQPGKGFIYLYPVNSGVLDTRFHVGSMSQAASIEQIIGAIDEMKGTTDWRRKSFSHGNEAGKKRRYLTGLVDLSLFCNEGHAERFTKVAMAAGAGGATYRKFKHQNLDGTESGISPAREISTMTVSEKQLESITRALEDSGLYTGEFSGEVHLNPVTRACTFLGN